VGLRGSRAGLDPEASEEIFQEVFSIMLLGGWGGCLAP
jgi:hypothetical protein